MIVVSGHLLVAPGERDAYLATCRDVVTSGRAAPGCRDFAISADLLDPRRVNILEVWDSAADVDAFRGGGVGGEQAAMVHGADVLEHEVADTHRLA